MEAGPVTKIRYWRVCEEPVDLLLNLGTRSGVTIYTYAEEPMGMPVSMCMRQGVLTKFEESYSRP